MCEPGSHLEPFQASFIAQQKSGHILGIGDTVANRRNKTDEVPAHMEPICLSPIMCVVINPSQVYNFQLAWLVSSSSLLTSAILQGGIFISLEDLGPVNK